MQKQNKHEVVGTIWESALNNKQMGVEWTNYSQIKKSPPPISPTLANENRSGGFLIVSKIDRIYKIFLYDMFIEGFGTLFAYL